MSEHDKDCTCIHHQELREYKDRCEHMEQELVQLRANVKAVAGTLKDMAEALEVFAATVKP